MKKLIIINIVVLILILCACLVACSPEEPPMPPGWHLPEQSIGCIHDLSVVFGAQYIYPPQDENIYSIVRGGGDPCYFGIYKIEYNERITEVIITTRVHDQKTTVRITKLQNIKDFIIPKDTAPIVVNGIDTYENISSEFDFVTVNFAIDKISYEVMSHSDYTDTTLLTAEQKQEYANELRTYIAMFKTCE